MPIQIHMPTLPSDAYTALWIVGGIAMVAVGGQSLRLLTAMLAYLIGGAR